MLLGTGRCFQSLVLLARVYSLEQPHLEHGAVDSASRPLPRDETLLSRPLHGAPQKPNVCWLEFSVSPDSIDIVRCGARRHIPLGDANTYSHVTCISRLVKHLKTKLITNVPRPVLCVLFDETRGAFYERIDHSLGEPGFDGERKPLPLALVE